MFGVNSKLGTEELLEHIKNNPPLPPPPKPEVSWHTGIVREGFKGAFQAPVDIGSNLLPYEYTPDPLKKNKLALNPEETGWAGQISHSLGHSLSAFLGGGSGALWAANVLRIAPLMANPLGLTIFGIGGAIAVALAVGRRVYEDLRDEGVDATTATKVGTASGLVGGSASLVNPFGKSALSSISSSAGINLATSFIDKGATKQLLESNNYHQLADNMEMFDKTSIAIDTITGSFFGYMHFKHKSEIGGGGVKGNVGGKGEDIALKPRPSEVDMAMGAKKDIHAMYDLNPGVQMNNESSEIYYRNFEKAQESFLKGEDFTMNSQEAEQLTLGTLFHPSEPLPPALENKLETFEAKIKALDDFAPQESHSPLRKDLQLVKNKIYETALACFYEHGGK